MLSEIHAMVHYLPKITLFYLGFSWIMGLDLNIIALIVAVVFDIIDYMPIG